jgi:hypothetical protein
MSLHHDQLLPKGQILHNQSLKAYRENEKTEDRKQQPEHADEYGVYSGEKSIRLRQM